MKQLLQDVNSGKITVDEVPAPARGPASLLIDTRYSLISAGTERAQVDMGRRSLIGKARARPDLVKKVVEAARADGLAATYSKVRGRLSEPTALGYSLSGMVLEACEDSPAAPGELVACAGAGYASHAEVVAVPRNLCARVPDGVPAEDAAYATVATIGLHGVRLAEVGLGDVVAVVGLGLVGQMTLELALAAGCVVLGTDPDPSRVDLARAIGCFATTSASALGLETLRLTSGRGADGVLVTAASRTSDPLLTAIQVARERAVISVVGDVAIDAPRAPLFSKELRLVVSRSYGPGRYDPTYEESGIDYPAGYVRWTEGRNLEEVLRLMAFGALRPSRLTTHTFDLERGPEAYALLESDEPSLGILLRHPGRDNPGERTVRLRTGRAAVSDKPRIGVIGAGSFARTVLLPALRENVQISAVVTSTGASARASAERFGAEIATTDPDEALLSQELDGVLIATRHDTHADYAARALTSGLHVFVEKPLALDEEGLLSVERALDASSGVLMVGFNRRFAPLSRRLRDALGGHGPLIITYRINAGRVPRTHWTHDPRVGGGRIVGEMCHFVDLAAFLCGSPPVEATAAAVGGGSEPRDDNVAATIRFADGSVASIVYAAFGDPSLPKERVEVLGEMGAGTMDDFRELCLHRSGKKETIRSKRDKGHTAEMEAFAQACRTGLQPWPVSDILAVMRATFDIRDAVEGRVA